MPYFINLFFSKKQLPTKEQIAIQEQKQTNLTKAIKNSSIKEVILCLQNGADPNGKISDSYIGTTVLQYAISITELSYDSWNDGLKILKLLLSEGASPLHQNLLERNALYYTRMPAYSYSIRNKVYALKLHETINNLLLQKYPQITKKNIKKISTILTDMKHSSLKKLCNDELQLIVSFLFTDQEKTKIFLQQMYKRHKYKRTNIWFKFKNYIIFTDTTTLPRRLAYMFNSTNNSLNKVQTVKANEQQSEDRQKSTILEKKPCDGSNKNPTISRIISLEDGYSSDLEHIPSGTYLTASANNFFIDPKQAITVAKTEKKTLFFAQDPTTTTLQVPKFTVFRKTPRNLLTSFANTSRSCESSQSSYTAETTEITEIHSKTPRPPAAPAVIQTNQPPKKCCIIL